MKPDSYMPFFGKEFAQAMAEYGREIAGSYILCLIHYWFHANCKGLRNDDSALRRLCKCDPGEWEETKSILFDNGHFFLLGADDLWHQKRADEEWRKAVEKYSKAVERGQRGAAATWKNHKPKRKER